MFDKQAEITEMTKLRNAILALESNKRVKFNYHELYTACYHVTKHRGGKYVVDELSKVADNSKFTEKQRSAIRDILLFALKNKDFHRIDLKSAYGDFLPDPVFLH